MAGDERGDHGEGATEDKAREVFGGFAFAEFGDVDADEHGDLLSEPHGVEKRGDCEPDGREGAGGDERAGTIAHEDEADGAGVDEEGEGSNDH